MQIPKDKILEMLQQQGKSDQCPDCSNGSWRTVTGGNSASDPAKLDLSQV